MADNTLENATTEPQPPVQRRCAWCLNRGLENEMVSRPRHGYTEYFHDRCWDSCQKYWDNVQKYWDNVEADMLDGMKDIPEADKENKDD